jgi:glycine betaine/proline transport system substrate-binding protein
MFSASHLARPLVVWVLAAGLAASAGASAQTARPGNGAPVKITYDSTAESLFQTDIVAIGLERLGYDVKPIVPLEIPAMYLAASTGDVDLTASAWEPLQNAYFDKAGGNGQLERVGQLIAGAALFSDDGKGKAQLFGCPPGWGCELAIEHQLDAYKLRPTVNHLQGDIGVLASEIIARYKSDKPVLYYTYNPYWVSQVLAPGKDVVQLTVPFTSLPAPTEPKLTTLPDGRNIGFTVNTIEVVGNSHFLEANPAAKKWLSLVKIPVEDVIAENYQVYKGEKSEQDIRKHAEAWMSQHAQEVDAWLAEASKTAAQ